MVRLKFNNKWAKKQKEDIKKKEDRLIQEVKRNKIKNTNYNHKRKKDVNSKQYLDNTLLGKRLALYRKIHYHVKDNNITNSKYNSKSIY